MGLTESVRSAGEACAAAAAAAGVVFRLVVKDYMWKKYNTMWAKNKSVVPTEKHLNKVRKD